MPDPFHLADLPALFERAARRTLAVRNLLLDGLDGKPVHITPAAFWMDEACVCSEHPLAGLMTESQFLTHTRRRHPTELDPCPYCGWDMRIVDFDTFTGLALPDPVQVLIIKGVWTHASVWRGTVHFQWTNEVCPECRYEVVR